jgi:ribosome biogenesis protein Tsr3
MTPTRLLVAFAATMLTIGTPLSAHAQAAQKKKSTSKKVLRLEEMKVEGRIQKPQAMFLMPRANLNYGDLERAESFLPKIAKATEKDPF